VSWDDGDYYYASLAINKNRRYHAMLRDFYRSAHNWTVGVNAFAGSAAFVAILASASTIAAVVSALFALAAIFESIFRYEERAQAHHDLCVRFTHLAAEIEELAETPEELARVRAKRIKIEADETEVKRLVEIRASNEECRARGIAEAKLIPLSWAQCKFGYVFTFGLRKLEKRKAAMEAAEEEQANAAS
jgi:hypothetical protein